MKTSKILFPLYALLILAFIWLSLPNLASNDPEPTLYIKHYPGGMNTDTVAIADSVWANGNKVSEQGWKWLEEIETPIVDKPE